MAEITVTFNGTATDLDDFCTQYNYQATINGEANPETKTQFLQRKVKEFVWQAVKDKRVFRASEDARQVELAKTVSF